MTVPLDLLMRCARAGVGLSRRNGSLIYSAAPDTPPDIRNAVRQYRAALLPLLEVDRIRGSGRSQTRSRSLRPSRSCSCGSPLTAIRRGDLGG